MGLDPGLRYTGWGVIEARGSQLRHVADGVVASQAGDPLHQRLRALYEGLQALMERYRPAEAAVERVFVNPNGASTLKLGQARGVALLVPALAGIVVGEYTPRAVKSAVTGSGAATKEQVAMMVRQMLPAASMKQADASDALAIAICHAHHRASHSRLAALGVASASRPSFEMRLGAQGQRMQERRKG
ncbi:crossover junction endodeoxyribonuclease RuvC [Oecophyllibacter saccharovorans]|uniref:Crossover junction endodeoxyribonuclease RuvC n=2 Tax=Oecophyllibacter saccharovorans TaxID=2558360 RepID=A0A506UN96_9PROT|nr:crossover junction endodeoxyribonuclease RuvC [Oecophyllibacter saccharovorans]